MSLERTQPSPTGLATADAVVDRAWQVLETLTDPEIPVVTLREMGIVREVSTIPERGPVAIEVIITPTYSGCPAMEQIQADVEQALAEAGLQAQVRTRLSPAWTTDWMGQSAKDKLRAYGIAPPGTCKPSETGAGAGAIGHATPLRPLQFARPFKPLAVHCPLCNSANTTEVSHFGSTACKALYKCLDCLEPFDHFKAI